MDWLHYSLMALLVLMFFHAQALRAEVAHQDRVIGVLTAKLGKCQDELERK